MIQWIVRPLLAVLFVLVLLYAGQAVQNLGGVTPPAWLPSWLLLDLDYVHSLSSEIGGSGIDALLIGSIVGIVVARFDRLRDAEAQRKSLRRRRQLKGGADLKVELETGTGRLPLAGLAFTGKTIEDCDINRARFVEHGRLSRILDLVRKPGKPVTAALKNVSFEGCRIFSSTFGGATGGVHLDQCQFQRCDIRWSDFRRAQFSNNAGLIPFEDTDLIGCSFEDATFSRADLSTARVRWCCFWGASLEDSQLPKGLYKALLDADLIVLDAARQSYYGVRSFWTLFRAPTLARVKFLARYLLGSRFP